MAVHIPKYMQVKEAVLNDIRSGKYNVGDKLPIREELINIYSVTRTTIDKALRELINDGVLKASRKLGTFVAEAEMKLKVAVVSTLRDPFSSTGGGNDQAQMIYTVISNATDITLDFFVPDEAVKKISLLAGYDRIVWTQPSCSAVELLNGIRDKVIITNRYYEQFSYVSTNHWQATFDVTDLMLKNCPKQSNVYYIGPAKNDFITKERSEGFVEACSKYQRFYRLLEADLNDFDSALSAMDSIDMGQPIILISASGCYTGAALAFERENKLNLYNNFFYADVDNINARQATGTKIISIIQDYKQMGMRIIEAIKHNGNEPYQCFVPYSIKDSELLEE